MRITSLLGGLALLTPLISADPIAYQVQKPPLDTEWTYKVGKKPWQDHPRPQMRRNQWKNLNGIWTYSRANGAGDINSPPSGDLDKEILIPSCVESGISGIQELNPTYMWFRTKFNVPPAWKGDRILLYFDAVDYESTVWVNGAKVKTNVGGYHRFSVDVTSQVKFKGQNDLLVWVRDPTDTEVNVVGKQAANPSHIFYRACSGIWQTVWMDHVPDDHIEELHIAADMDGKVTMNVTSSGRTGRNVQVTMYGDDGLESFKASGKADGQFDFTVPKGKFEKWSPASPHLYNLTISMGKDHVHSYTGFRTVSTGQVDGVQRPMINGEFTYLFAPLDQGYWPDGLYTPPTREAMVSDITFLKELGFNMIRKHIKVEPDLFYRACDEMGIMVMQDMPSMPANTDQRAPTPDDVAEWRRQYELLVRQHQSFTSIVSWVVINEGWGQPRQPPWSEQEPTEWTRKADPTRMINSVTGWFDHGFGDFSDNHHYANPQCGTPFFSLRSSPYDPKRIGFQGEFAGLGQLPDEKYLWNVQEAIQSINQTYELHQTTDTWNYRSHVLFRELTEQTKMFACSGGIWTQTTDVEGEVNGLKTYDRRFARYDAKQWKSDIQGLYDAAKGRGGAGRSP